MSDQLPMFGQANSPDTPNATSLPESGSGVTRSVSQDGQTNAKSGPEVAPAKVLALPGKGLDSRTNVTSGQNGSDLSRTVDLPSYSENKSPHHQSLDRPCKGCHIVKPINCFRKHNRNGFRHTCRTCENRWVRTTKPWDSDEKRQYQRDVRNKRRGLSLTTDAKQRAKSKGIPFSLEWRNIQKRIDAGICEVTGIPFDLMTPKSWNAPSIDQIIPGMGYTPENVRVILLALNTMANNWGFSKILEIADALRKAGIK